METEPEMTRDRVAAAPSSSSAWKLGLPVKPYIWRRDDPERDAKIAAERADTAQKREAGRLAVAARMANQRRAAA